MAVDALFLKNHLVVTSRVRSAVSRSLVVRTAWPAIPRLVLRVLGTLHRLLFHASGGRLGCTVRGGPVLLLTTTGRESGRSRTWPVCCLPIGDDLVLVASAAGAPRQPAWYLNLQADPRVTIRLADRVQTMVARTAEGVERARLWEWFVRQYPVCASYQRNTARAIPVVVLTPLSQAERGHPTPGVDRR
jgi:deazaflavin-dependent oxidoreductase (nitroreductase family)